MAEDLGEQRRSKDDRSPIERSPAVRKAAARAAVAASKKTGRPVAPWIKELAESP